MENKKLVTIIILVTTVILAGIALFTALKLYQVGQETAPMPSVKLKAVKPSVGEVPLVAQQQPGGACELAFNVAVSPSSTPEVSPTPTPSVSPSSTPEVSPTPTPSSFSDVSPSPTPSSSPIGCWDVCETDSQCPGSYVCQNVSGVYRCVNGSCSTESDCVCGLEASPTPTPTPTPAIYCWDVCENNSQCPSSLECQNISGVNRCVNASCSTESDCACGISPAPSGALVVPQASTVATQQLPEAGFVSPTLVFSLGGLVLILLGLLF